MNYKNTRRGSTQIQQAVIKQSIIPELVSGSSTPAVIKRQALKTLKKFQGLSYFTTARGFTLVELVVVVLIIIILTAVALPMYKHAVVKSKFSTVIPPTKSLADAQEVFYLNNGEYAEGKEEIDVALPNTSQVTINLSDWPKYQYVLGHHADVPGVNYIIYQKHSKRFADNIHCEALKDDNAANWLCEKGLGGTLITGAISGSNWVTYLLSGEVGDDRFIRRDCANGYYDKDGVCTRAPENYYADDGELYACEAGTSRGFYGSGCTPCTENRYGDTDGGGCNLCPSNTYATGTGSTSCQKCPAGTTRFVYASGGCTPCPENRYGDTDGEGCNWCPSDTYTTDTGSTSVSSCQKCPAGTTRLVYASGGCTPCPEGKYGTAPGSGCKACPSGQTNNADHTGCVPA